ncbi:OmpA family protein [candidate division KSB1 bacterium]|nr:OmpA family protein [candidate division KSB1 bacterium]
MNRRSIIFIFMLAIIVTFSAQSFGWEGAVAVGLRGGVTYYMGDDFEESLLKHSFSVYGENYFTNRFSLESALNISRMAGEEDEVSFKTDLTGLSLLGRFSLLGSKAFRPYIAAGAEVVSYEPMIENEGIRPLDRQDREITFAVPVGGGISVALFKNLLLDLRGLYHYALHDEMDYTAEGAKDAYVTATAGLTLVVPSNKDVDNDGLLRSDEKKLGTDPKLADTDGDGITDGDEALKLFTDPLKMDTDGDGISDYDEINVNKTDPLKTDSDDDKLSDYEEMTAYKTNPLAADTDGDGLDDYAELKTHGTDPIDKDTDNDGLDDQEELLTYKTDPLKNDTDEDKVNDGDEVNKHKTSPLIADTDGGSVDDGVEVRRGTSPLDASDDVILEVETVGAKIILDGIEFASGKSAISEKSAEILNKAFTTLKAYPEMEVEIQGYTDNVGRYSFNKTLSQRRADAVRKYLIDLGVDAGRIVAKGYGPDNPIDTNDTAEGRARNRRIEFVRIK